MFHQTSKSFYKILGKVTLPGPAANSLRKFSGVPQQPQLSRSQLQEYSSQEVEIPVSVPGNAHKGLIAGRIFQGKPDSTSSQNLHPLICVPGWGDTVAAFDPLLPQIVCGRNVSALAFDMTGHGRSSHPPGPYVDLHNETVLTILRLIRHYKWEKVTLMGHSFGGLVALSFAAIFPNLVHSFVGIDILPAQLAFGIDTKKTLFPFTRELMSIKLDTEAKVASGRPIPEYTREEMIKRMQVGRARQGGLSVEGCELLIDRGSRVLPNGKLVFSNDPRWQSFFYTGLISLGSNMQTFAENMKCPVCLINFSHMSDEELGVAVAYKKKVDELADMMRKSVPKLEVSKVDAPHHGHLLNPELVSPIVNSFLESNP